MSGGTFVEINLTTQSLKLFMNDKLQRAYLISTSLNGPGELMGSECTPRGLHAVAEMIGEDQNLNTVFVGRTVTGESYTTLVAEKFPERDWILTRLIWLKGLESGRNLGGNCDTQARYIYIHGTPDEAGLGKVGSHGCIRMSNNDVVELFDCISINTRVNICT